MNRTAMRIHGGFVLVTLVTVMLQQVFTSLLFERHQDHWVEDLLVGMPALVIGLLLASWRLSVLLKPVQKFLQNSELDHLSRLNLRQHLSRTFRFLLIVNGLLFLIVPVAVQFLRLGAGMPLPALLDLTLIMALGLAFGFMASLQELSFIESLTLPLRRHLGLTDVEGTTRDLSLRERLFLVNIGSVLLAGLLAGMAALGFYREVVAYYTSLAADAITAASAVSNEAVDDNEVKVVLQLGALFLAVLTWTVFLTFTALGNVSRQLKTLENRVQEMAEGSADLDQRAEVLFFDEVGSLTGRINAVMARLQQVVGAIQTTALQVLESTATVGQVSRDAESQLEAVASARKQAEEALSGQGDALSATLSVAQDLEQSSVTVKSVAEEQGVAVTRGAAAMEQLASSVASVRDLTNHADHLAGSLRQTSEEGGHSVEAVRKAMEAIQEAARAVGGTVASIKKTASQTNLLAMNAAIEAAHDGSSGLGFAVVASEVRTLAEDSRRGATTIADLMRDMGTKIAEGDRLAREAGAAFSRIFGLIVQTSEVMSTVARAMDEQKAGTETLLSTTRTLREVSGQIGSVTEKQATHAENLNRSVHILLETGAALAMAQEVQGRSMLELTELVKTVAREAAHNSEAAGSLSQTVSGFRAKG